MLIPGLLQTTDYAREVITWHPPVPSDEVEDRVTARTERGRVFERPAPAELTFVIHEWVLRTPVGGAEVMSDQLHHLLWPEGGVAVRDSKNPDGPALRFPAAAWQEFLR